MQNSHLDYLYSDLVKGSPFRWAFERNENW